MENAPQPNNTPPPSQAPGAPYAAQGNVNITVAPPPSNGCGTAGFVLALIGLFVSWIPVLGWIIWLLGLILSAVGMKKQPKGLATAGLVLSLIDFVALLVMIGCTAAVAAAAADTASTL